jgi:hypothetical protein
MDGKDGAWWCNNHGFTIEATPATSLEDCCCEAYEAIEYDAFGGGDDRK